MPIRNRNKTTIKRHLFLFIWQRKYFNSIWERYIIALRDIAFTSMIDPEPTIGQSSESPTPEQEPNYRGVTMRELSFGTSEANAIVLDDSDNE